MRPCAASFGVGIDERKHLSEIAVYCRATKGSDTDLLRRCLATSIEASDQSAALIATEAVAEQHTKFPRGVPEALFLSALQFFISNDDTRWVDAVRMATGDGSLFTTFDEVAAETVLAALVREPRIEHPVEELLCDLAVAQPLRIVDFFGERLKFADTPSAPRHYDAIPHRFSELSEQFIPIANDLVRVCALGSMRTTDSFNFGEAAWSLRRFQSSKPSRPRSEHW